MAKKKPKSETAEILEIVNFIKDHMVENMMTRDEANERFLEINGRLFSIEQELKDIKRRLNQLETSVEKFGRRYKDDIEELWKHVAAIEKQLKMHRS